jgi:tetratricopeptide (TPR) repeat protein
LQALSVYIATLAYGPTHAREMVRELDELEGESESAYLQAFIEAGRSEVARLEARFDDARQWARRSRETYGRFTRHMEAFGWDELASAELSAGDLAAALAAFERADACHADSGMEGFRATVLARIADLRVALGDHAAARDALELSERLAGSDDVANALVTARVRAALALAEGDLGEAERCARSSIELALGTDFPGERAESRLQLARVLAASGRCEEATAEAREALTIYESKGDRPGMGASQALLDELNESAA